MLTDWGAITGRTITVSRKFALYWIQSQTTRVAARSASDWESASTIGAIAARAPADSRSRRTARMSISTRGPSCGTLANTGLNTGRQTRGRE